MSRAVRQILEAALKLSAKDREQLVTELGATLQSGFASENIEQAWARDIGRRATEIDSGKAALRDWCDVRNDILAELARTR